MSAFIALAALAVFYFVGYRGWSKWLAEKVFALSDDEVTPAHELRDDIDYMPTNKHVLWGHHYTSIAGAAPIRPPNVSSRLTGCSCPWRSIAVTRICSVSD